MVVNSKPLRTLLLVVLVVVIALGADMLLGWDPLTVLAVETMLLACYAVA